MLANAVHSTVTERLKREALHMEHARILIRGKAAVQPDPVVFADDPRDDVACSWMPGSVRQVASAEGAQRWRPTEYKPRAVHADLTLDGKQVGRRTRYRVAKRRGSS